MKKCVLLMTLFSLPTLASACDLYTPATLPTDESYEAAQLDNAGVCISLRDGWEYTSEHLLNFDVETESGAHDVNYWNGWIAADSNDTNPFLTQQLENSYLGLSVWMPTELAARENQMSTEEWLMSHGLKLSLGFGQKKAGEPRVRLDYRWHEVYQADWFMQIEVPF
ncbi:hypothetical protein ABXZ88_004552 [Vibrio fluvialis]|nr:hypothetical protein [Vibrio fluvialis]MBY8011817.1 hypothetical protein [Vibrio fluvialis]MBY8015457.1 hypothetical protein [Vibrio fluvialis]MBY8271542.1 hypothetical protein [Vibrio fluvialis]